jgi:hypothetical protein
LVPPLEKWFGVICGVENGVELSRMIRGTLLLFIPFESEQCTLVFDEAVPLIIVCGF